MSKQKHYSGALSRRLLLRYAASLAAVAGTVLLLAAFAVLFLGNFGFWRRTAGRILCQLRLRAIPITAENQQSRITN